jgi:4-hydroxy-tetrahydrodipicolinate reductase
VSNAASDSLRICVFGAAGRMGREIIKLCDLSPGASLAGATVRTGSDLDGRDAGTDCTPDSLGIALTSNRQSALRGANVAIDFTLPDALAGNLAACREAECPIVVGTTGVGEEAYRALEAAAQDIPVIYARNTSVGVNLAGSLVATAARAIGDQFDMSIVETHHRDKRDAPSGTALELAERMVGARLADGGDYEAALAENIVLDGGEPDPPQSPGTIRISSIRTGAVAGEHDIVFRGEEEELRISHRALSRAVFARGALRAAVWLHGRTPGLYSMDDVLGL